MEPVAIFDKNKVEFLNGSKTNTVDSLGIQDGTPIYKNVKEETEDDTELSHEFKAESNELAEEVELESTLWVKPEYEVSSEMCIKEEWTEAYNEAALRKEFGCESEPVVNIQRLGLDRLSHYWQDGRQLSAENQGLDLHEWCSDTAGASGSRLRPSEFYVGDGRNCTVWQQMRQASEESGPKAAAIAGSTFTAQSCETKFPSGPYLDKHSTGYPQEQVLNQPKTEHTRDLHLESNGNPVLGSVICKGVRTPHEFLAVEADMNHFHEQLDVKTEISSEVLNSDLSQHYTDQNLHECYVCGRKFSQKSYLTLHEKIHASGKPFECNVCKKKFTRKSHLYSHAYIHASEKPFECRICKKTFTQKSHLITHVYIHTGEKPYECSVCGKNLPRSHV